MAKFKKNVRNLSLMVGFSLLELILVLLFLSILMTMTSSFYLSRLKQSHCHEGQLALIDLAYRMERYFSEQNTYETATLGTGKESDVKSSALSAEGNYLLSIQKQTRSTYFLKAESLSLENPSILTLSDTGEKRVVAGGATCDW